MHTASYWKIANGKILCSLCPQACLISDGHVGYCSVRANIDMSLYALSYGRISSKALDPIEKKPLYKYFTGKPVLSIGSLGCNLGCPFCQNWQIAHLKDRFLGKKPQDVIIENTQELLPAEVAETAQSLKDRDNIGVAYTYNEPFMSYEYVVDCARLVRDIGLKNILVTNGFINRRPLAEALPLIDAMNIDLKGFSEEIYRKLGGKLAPVKNAIRQVAESHCHLEITNLLVPGLNDDMEMFGKMVDWIAGTTGSETVLHISRYFPSHIYRKEATPVILMEKARDIAAKKLKNVFLGNI